MFLTAVYFKYAFEKYHATLIANFDFPLKTFFIGMKYFRFKTSMFAGLNKKLFLL